MHQYISSLSRTLVLLFLMTGLAAETKAATLSDEAVSAYSRQVFFGFPDLRLEALEKLEARGLPDIAATLILAMRFLNSDVKISETFQSVTGSNATNWYNAMLWQEAHPEITPHPSYITIKTEVLKRIDPQFLRFISEEHSAPENMKIRLEEITWGGVGVDGIPSLDNPSLIVAEQADYLLDDDLVFGVSINGDNRAYPLRIMGWHEMFNDIIGGVPVALAYCTLCGSGILFETKVTGQDVPYIFGSSGFLYRSNKLMFDRQTDSLWNQFTGEPVSGPLVHSGIKLNIRPVAITSWKNWKTRHPNTKVLSIDTGYTRNYGSGVVYNDYFSSPDLMFPALVSQVGKTTQKDYVFGIRQFAVAKAWPVEAFDGGNVINDAIGNRNIVLIGDASTRTVRAYYRNDLTFQKVDGSSDQLLGPDGNWGIEEDHLEGPDGTLLARVAGHVAYWFAWDSYLGVKSELYTPSVIN